MCFRDGDKVQFPHGKEKLIKQATFLAYSICRKKAHIRIDGDKRPITVSLKKIKLVSARKVSQHELEEERRMMAFVRQLDEELREAKDRMHTTAYRNLKKHSSKKT